MTSDRIKEIQESTAYPESVSVQQALLQVWNECEQDAKSKERNSAWEAMFIGWKAARKKYVSNGGDDFAHEEAVRFTFEKWYEQQNP